MIIIDCVCKCNDVLLIYTCEAILNNTNSDRIDYCGMEKIKLNWSKLGDKNTDAFLERFRPGFVIICTFQPIRCRCWSAAESRVTSESSISLTRNIAPMKRGSLHAQR